MTKFLINLFEAPEVSFRQLIDELERKSGRQSLDIRLTNAVQHEAKELRDYLSLEDDLSDKEVYYHINAHVELENSSLEQLLGITSDTAPSEVVDVIISYFSNHLPKHQGYFIKSTVCKLYLKKYLPKKTMKLLSYRSVDSLLKRESLPLILSLALECESADWLRHYEQFQQNLLASDGFAHEVGIKQIDEKALERLASSNIKQRYFIRESLELGQSIVVPMSKRFHCDTIAYVVAMLDSLARLQLHGTYYNYLRFQPDFGKRLHLVVRDGIHKGTEEYFDMMWPAYYKYISANANHDEDFMNQPIIHVPDILAHYFAVKTPWHRFSASVHGVEQPVSLNVIDIVTNASNKLPFERRFLHHAQQEVWDRLHTTYMQYRNDVDF